MNDIRTALRDAVTSSFFPYLSTTFLLNIPPFALGLATVISDECESNWLVFNGFLCFLHMAVATYIVYRIRALGSSRKGGINGGCDDESKVYLAPVDDCYQGMDVKGVNGSSDGPAEGPPNSWDRVRAVMCYDMVMACYYILFLVWVIWESNGTRIILENHPQDQSCGNWMVLSVIFGFLFMGLVLVAWTASLCLLRFRRLSERRTNSDRRSKEVTSREGPLLKIPEA